MWCTKDIDNALWCEELRHSAAFDVKVCREELCQPCYKRNLGSSARASLTVQKHVSINGDMTTREWMVFTFPPRFQQWEASPSTIKLMAHQGGESATSLKASYQCQLNIKNKSRKQTTSSWRNLTLSSRNLPLSLHSFMPLYWVGALFLWLSFKPIYWECAPYLKTDLTPFFLALHPLSWNNFTHLYRELIQSFPTL